MTTNSSDVVGHAPASVDMQGSVPLPTLRQDLELLKGWPLHNGEPTWILFDPLRNQYFRLNKTNFVFISHWQLNSTENVRMTASRRLNRDVDMGELSDLLQFLFTNQLTDTPAEEGYRSFFKKAKQGQRGWLSSALHGYLFFRIPLFRPDRFLVLTWPLVSGLFTRSAVILMIILALAGMHLVSRQWSEFSAQFLELISLNGLMLYIASLAFVKVCHELGHAYMAHRYGLKVPVIGVAFLVLMPILYTDCSNAWRLKSRRDRLMTDGAGIMAELYLASIATTFWVFLPDGPERTVAFSIATVSWVFSLLINLNPLMRFDGYFMVSDVLGIENLQSRGFSLAKWKLREFLFGLGLATPERLSPSLQRIVILHAWSTWIYRFFLFLGIALLIYTFFVKVVALFLFAVEILWFIAFPILRELKVWWETRSMIIKSPRSYLSFSLFALGLLVYFAPISNKVTVPAVLHAANELDVYPPHHGLLKHLGVSNGDMVKAGQRLAEIESPELLLRIDKNSKQIALIEARLARSGTDAPDLALRSVLISELAGKKDQLEALKRQLGELVVFADADGQVVDLDAGIHEGRHVSRRTLMFRVKGMSRTEISGLVSERDVERIAVDAKGTFYPENLQLAPVSITLRKIDETAAKAFDFPSLAEVYGGDVPSITSNDSSESLNLVGSYFAVVAEPELTDMNVPEQARRGAMKVEATSRSLAAIVSERVVAVLRRESGF